MTQPMDTPDMRINAMNGSAADPGVLDWIKEVLVKNAVIAIEVLAVAIILMVIARAAFHCLLLFYSRRPRDRSADYREYRHRIARVLLLSLEMLVAADLVRIVVLESTLQNVFVLGCLILIRTFLNWTLMLEIENRWPWQAPHSQIQIGSSEFSHVIDDIYGEEF
jgi:uncharacterized membrane protein